MGDAGRLALYGGALVGSLLVALLLTPVARRVAIRFGLLDQPAPHKVHQRATPYLGGLAIGGALLVAGTVSAGTSGKLTTILLGGGAVAFLGFVDDWRTVGPVTKVAVEAIAALALWLAGIRAGIFGAYVPDLLLTVAWVVGVTNALNLLDNMDGLATGVAAIASSGAFVIAASRGDFLLGSFALAVAGACLGFLRHNFPPARIFLGDAGALLLGFVIAALTLQLDLAGDGALTRASVSIILLGVPLFDTGLVVADRLRARRPVYVGGTDHFSHRLVRSGFTVRAVALTGCAAEASCAAIAVWLAVARSTIATALTDLAMLIIGGTALLWLLRLTPRADDASPAPPGADTAP